MTTHNNNEETPTDVPHAEALNGQVPSKRMLDYFKYRSMGLDKAQASELAGMRGPGDVSDRALRLREEKYRQYRLKSPEFQKMAHEQLTRILSGQPIVHTDADGNETARDYPNNSNVLTAVGMIVDRVEPIVKETRKTNVNISLAPVDLDQYKQIQHQDQEKEEDILDISEDDIREVTEEDIQDVPVSE